MSENRKSGTRKVGSLVVALLLVLALAACSSAGTNNAADTGSAAVEKPAVQDKEAAPPKEEPAAPVQEEPLELDVMLPSFFTDNPKDDSPVVEDIEKATNTAIHFDWVPSSNYEDKFNITIASGKLPALMISRGKNSSFINAARSGAFWDVGPYLKDYPNLSGVNATVLDNVSIDGKVYGVYRARPLGRFGTIIRQDWLENLGLQPPKTLDEFYNVLKAFTENDPDQNGKNDTYGMVVSKYNLPWEMIQVWFGAPNKWGVGADGKLVPDHMTKEYMDALQFFKKLYDEKLVNEDFAVMDPAKWGDPLINGQTGVVLAEADAVVSWEAKLHAALQSGNRDEPDRQYLAVYGAVAGPQGLRMIPTSGHAGVISVSKSVVKTEDELKRVLTFLDQLNDAEMQILAVNGIEGRHFNKVENGIEASGDAAIMSEVQGLIQMMMYIPEDRSLKAKTTPLLTNVATVMKENESIAVPDPTGSLVSDVFAQKGAQLNNIINDARTKYIVGQIDETGMQEAIDLWLKSGGEEYIAEINELYAASKK